MTTPSKTEIAKMIDHSLLHPTMDDQTLKEGIELVSPDSNYCSGHVIPVSIEGLPAAVVIPAEDVRMHQKNIIEIISPKMLKDTLDVKDGDQVNITINRH